METRTNNSQLEIGEAIFKIEGTAPLIIHKFSEKAQEMIEDKQAKKPKGGRAKRNPQEDYEQSLYKLSDGKKYGFPSGGFKAAMVRAGEQLEWKMTQLKVRFFVVPDEKETNLIEIVGEPRMRTDMVRIGMGTADVRYRPEFVDWKATIKIQYNKKGISEEQLAELLALAGFSVGIGEWRPGKAATGSYGTWRLV